MNVNLIGASYVDSTPSIAYQDTVNWIPEVVEVEGARSTTALRTPPGLEQLGTATGSGCRGMIVFQGSLYAVYGSRLLSINTNGVATDIGFIAGNGPVSMAVNAHQLGIATGSTPYVYDGTLMPITGLSNPNTVTFLDQYMIFDGDGGQFQITALNDISMVDPIDFATAESAPDDTVAVLADHQELLIFGKETVEVWVNTGDVDFPFARTSGSLIERGTLSPHTLRKVDNTVYWLDNFGMVQAMAGHTPQRISTHALEQEIKLYLGRYDEFFAWSYVDKGHWFYVLQFPGLGKTMVFDAATKLWHTRKSYGEDCWRARFHAQVYDKHIVGDFASTRIWNMKDGVYEEGSDPMVSERYTQYVHNEENPVFNHSVWLLFDAGQGLTSGQGSDPMVDFRWSDDGGRNFSNYRQRSLGKIGEYKTQVRFHALGMFRSRMFHIRVSDPIKRDMITAYIRPSAGANA